MLKLSKVIKVYNTKNVSEVALKGIDLEFQKGELVSIVGPSGCGKTTLLNIIGGLDRYTSGDLIINGKSTKEFKDSDWDSYRNSSIGFVFQSYNLISHLSILSNVEMAMTLSGKSPKERKAKALEVLEKVGLKDHINKKPNQLSGGQKQRVAIARALTNDPDIILADEPTGALDTKISIQIMDLIKEICSDKLVILVTHNKEIAEQYSTRIINLLDGKIVSDNKTNKAAETVNRKYEVKKTKMSYLTALKLSGNNLKKKWIRTFITAVAGSIGIIGIALVLAIANGFNNEVSGLQKDALSGLPITMEEKTLTNMFSLATQSETGDDAVYQYDAESAYKYHTNNFSTEFLNYLNNMDKSYYDTLYYNYGINYNVMTKSQNNNIKDINVNVNLLIGGKENLDAQFDILYTSSTPLEAGYEPAYLIIDENNQLDKSIITALLGTDYSTEKKINYEEFIGYELSFAKNNDYYEKIDGLYYEVTDKTNCYNNGYKAKVTTILKMKDSNTSMLVSTGLAVADDFIEICKNDAMNSNIAKDQKASEVVLLDETITLEQARRNVGAVDTPEYIYVFAKDFSSKEKIKDYIDAYNSKVTEDNKIVYTDIADTITGMISTVVDGISVVLVAIAAISLVVSSIMIGIITYVSVLERTKEIGILRSLGARKKDIRRVFISEAILVGLFAGVLGISTTYLLSLILNPILSGVTGMNNICSLSIISALVLIGISIMLTAISGLLPAIFASRKNPVEALRAE